MDGNYNHYQASNPYRVDTASPQTGQSGRGVDSPGQQPISHTHPQGLPQQMHPSRQAHVQDVHYQHQGRTSPRFSGQPQVQHAGGARMSAPHRQHDQQQYYVRQSQQQTDQPGTLTSRYPAYGSAQASRRQAVQTRQLSRPQPALEGHEDELCIMVDPRTQEVQTRFNAASVFAPASNRFGFDFNGVRFSSAYQFVQYQKAMMFQRPDIAANILATTHFARQHALGNEIPNFNPLVWEANKGARWQAAYNELCRQNPALLTELLGTQHSLVEQGGARDNAAGNALTILRDVWRNDPNVLRSSMQTIQMNDGQTAVCFWKAGNPLSNWYPSPFIYNGVQFQNMEQYLMYQKAVVLSQNLPPNEVAHNRNVMAKILATSDPAEAKRLAGTRGELVGWHTNGATWETWRKEYAIAGLEQKFGQNPVLSETLMQTRGSLLIEASPYDKIWGVGLKVEDPRIRDNPKPGTNLLGDALMEVRNRLEQENPRA